MARVVNVRSKAPHGGVQTLWRDPHGKLLCYACTNYHHDARCAQGECQCPCRTRIVPRRGRPLGSISWRRLQTSLF